MRHRSQFGYYRLVEAGLTLLVFLLMIGILIGYSYLAVAIYHQGAYGLATSAGHAVKAFNQAAR